MNTVRNTLDPTEEKKGLFGNPLVKLALGLAIFLGSAGFFGLLSLNLAVKRGEKVTIPNLVNKSVVEALDALSERSLELRKAGARNSALIPENYILSQDPIAGTVVKEGTPVSVVISLGSKLALVPDLSGKSLREAKVELNRAGLAVGRFSRMYYNGAIDMVLAQAPLPDSQVERDAPVDMLISLGPRPREFRLPNLTGRTLERANTTLEAMGLVVGEITTKLDPSRPHGFILDQSPQSGSLIKEGSAVSLVMTTMKGEGIGAERKFAVFLYKVPYGFWAKTVKVEISDADGTRTIYNEVDEPGAPIRLMLGYSVQCTIKVYLNDEFEMERVFR